jgi:hypothetical protein
VDLDISTKHLLQSAASARRITPNELARRIIHIVLTDNLLNGVLDDQPESSNAAS